MCCSSSISLGFLLFCVVFLLGTFNFFSKYFIHTLIYIHTYPCIDSLSVQSLKALTPLTFTGVICGEKVLLVML